MDTSLTVPEPRSGLRRPNKQKIICFERSPPSLAPVLLGSCPWLLSSLAPVLLLGSWLLLGSCPPPWLRRRPKTPVEALGPSRPSASGSRPGAGGPPGTRLLCPVMLCSRFRRGRGGGKPRDSRGSSGQLGVWRPRYAGWGCGRGVCSKKSNNPNLSGGEKTDRRSYNNSRPYRFK